MVGKSGCKLQATYKWDNPLNGDLVTRIINHTKWDDPRWVMLATLKLMVSSHLGLSENGGLIFPMK